MYHNGETIKSKLTHYDETKTQKTAQSEVKKPRCAQRMEALCRPSFSRPNREIKEENRDLVQKQTCILSQW